MKPLVPDEVWAAVAPLLPTPARTGTGQQQPVRVCDLAPVRRAART